VPGCDLQHAETSDLQGYDDEDQLCSHRYLQRGRVQLPEHGRALHGHQYRLQRRWHVRSLQSRLELRRELRGLHVGCAALQGSRNDFEVRSVLGRY
jgi:hypothetical protein